MEAARLSEIVKCNVKKLAIQAKTAFLAEKIAGCDETVTAIGQSVFRWTAIAG